MVECTCTCLQRICRCSWNNYTALIKSRKKVSLTNITERYKHEMKIVSYKHPLLAFELRCYPIQVIGRYLNKIIQETEEKNKSVS